MKKVISLALAALLLFVTAAPALAYEESVHSYLVEDDYESVDAAIFDEGTVPTTADDLQIPAPCAILIEKESGAVIYEKNADEMREPASVTKVMTILLIVEAIEAGVIGLDDMITTSAYAASMGGSQIFLEEGEQMSVSDMLKAIVVSSANDAAVAMAEKLSGSEDVFASRMNERAKELGMTNTNFTNCSGLRDDPTHVTTARDIAIMSRELIKHGMIKEYTTIWMDTVRGGEFGLSNTNKLIYYYDGATGLKTGFTSRSMYCLSATAERDGVEYIAVVMNAATSADRFESAKSLLSYGFANYTTISAEPDSVLPPLPVQLGNVSHVQPVVDAEESLLIPKSSAAEITKTVEIDENLVAPLSEGDKIGKLTISDSNGAIGVYPIVAGNAVEKLSWGSIFMLFVKTAFAGGY